MRAFTRDICNKFKQQNTEEATKPLEVSQLQSKVVVNVSGLKEMLCLTHTCCCKAGAHRVGAGHTFAVPRDGYLGWHKVH